VRGESPHTKKRFRPSRDESARLLPRYHPYCPIGGPLCRVRTQDAPYTPVRVTANEAGQVYSGLRPFGLATPEGFSGYALMPGFHLPRALWMRDVTVLVSINVFGKVIIP